MSQKEKLDKRVRSRPKDLRFEEIAKFLENYDFVLSNIVGSHYTYERQGLRVVIVKPHGKSGSQHIPAYKIKEVIETVDSVSEV